MIIKLIDITKNDTALGSNAGKKAYQKILSIIQKNIDKDIFEISFEGIVFVDAIFLREGIVSIAKQFIAKKAVYVTNIKNRDILENLNYAAQDKNQPIFFWKNKEYEILGPKITDVTKELINTVVQKGPISAAQIAPLLSITSKNAGVKLIKIFKNGYVYRVETVAPTGGIEFLYKKIK